MFGFFRKRREVETLKKEIEESFSHVKKDFAKVGDWISHLDGKHEVHEKELLDIKNQILGVQKDLLEIKDVVSFFGTNAPRALFKQPQTTRDKQPLSVAVQTGSQTAVETDVLANLTLMERAIVWALLNANMKLSYEDLSAILGKDKSTIRGQINAIRRKSESLIEEVRESNGKKRVYIPEEVRDKVLKGVKVRIKTEKSKRKY